MEIIQYLFFDDWLFYLKCHQNSFMLPHVLELPFFKGQIIFFCIYILFINLLGYFYFFIAVSNATMNMGVKHLLKTRLLIALNIYRIAISYDNSVLSGIAVSYNNSVFLIFLRIIVLQCYYFTFPPIVYKGYSVLISLTILVIFCLFGRDKRVQL